MMFGHVRGMRIVVLSALVAGLLCAGSWFAPARAQDGRVKIDAKEVESAKAELKKLGPEPRAFVLISRIVRPSVVSVVTKHKQAVPQFPDFFGEDWPDDVPSPFGRRSGRQPRRPAPEQEVFAMGSGIMVDKSGHILTNNHVVAGAIEIKVGLADDSQYEAELVGTDESTDLAIIKLKDCPADKIVPAVFGDSNQLEVGQWVLTVGAPYGRTKSVSAGIVSATGRRDVIPEAMRETGKIYYENFIQTDAAINRGNSGGPLVNYQGEVVGINAAIETRTGDYAGVGFAIPSSLAKPVMEQLIARGKVVRGYLGVNIAEITDAHVKDLKLSTREGVVVEEVKTNTPAERAGVKAKDVIVAVNGKPALSVVQLQSLVTATEPGTKIKLDVLRDGKAKAIEVVVDELPREVATAEAKFADEELGITVHPLTPELAQQSGYPGETGLLVMSVVEGSPADKAGIKEKDLITEVANASVATVGDFTRARKGQSIEKGVLLLVKTGDKARLALVK